MFSELFGLLRFVWNSPISYENITLTPAQKNDLYEQNPVLRDYFVEGAPGYLKKNLNPNIRLANGTPVTYHSLILNDQEDFEAVMQLIVDASSSADIHLHYPPKYICVEVPSADPFKFVERTLVPGKVVIPIPLKQATTKKTYSTGEVKAWKINVPGFGIREIIARRHQVDLAFALTTHKVMH
jgi:hypothetical protein